MNEKLENIIWSFFVMVLTTATLLYVLYASRPKEETQAESKQVEQSIIEIKKVE